MFADSGAYPGRYYIKHSEDGISWVLDYSSDSGVPLIGGLIDYVYDRLLPGAYIRNFGGFEDRIREIHPGVWLGRVYALPGMLSWDLSLGNPTPFTIYTGVSFLLFQQC